MALTNGQIFLDRKTKRLLFIIIKVNRGALKREHMVLENYVKVLIIGLMSLLHLVTTMR